MVFARLRGSNSCQMASLHNTFADANRSPFTRSIDYQGFLKECSKSAVNQMSLPPR